MACWRVSLTGGGDDVVVELPAGASTSIPVEGGDTYTLGGVDRL